MWRWQGGGLRREEIWQQLTQELKILSGDVSPLRPFSNNFRKNCIFPQCVLKHTISEFTMNDVFHSRFCKSDPWPLSRDSSWGQALCCPRPGLTEHSECRAWWDRKRQLTSPPKTLSLARFSRFILDELSNRGQSKRSSAECTC